MSSSFRKPTPVTRVAAGEYNTAGVWVEGQPATLSIPMSVQPMKLSEMEALPEGRRSSRAVKIYSDAELIAADQDTGQNGDIVTWLGKKWEVVSCMPYQGGVIPHWKALAVEVKAN